MQEMQVQSLGWEDALEKGMAPIPVFLLENTMDSLQFIGSQRIRYD